MDQTLHDFVLNLLTDPEARTAFNLDPEGTLNEAGLGDITAADVNDVVPLVVDYASPPAGDLAAPVNDLGVGALDTDATNAIDQLQAVTQQLGVNVQSTTVDGGAAAAGAIAVDPGVGLGVSGNVVGGLSVGAPDVPVDLSGVDDPAESLDSNVVDQVATDATAVTGAAGDTALATADNLLQDPTLDNVLNTTGSAVDGVTGTLDGATGAVGLDGVGGTVDAVTGTVDGVTGDLPVGGELTGANASLGSDATGAVDTPLGGLDAGGLLDTGSGGAAPGDGGTAPGNGDNGLLGDISLF